MCGEAFCMEKKRIVFYLYCKSENEYTSVLSLFMYIHVKEVTFKQKK
jgi:hypothetical protein